MVPSSGVYWDSVNQTLEELTIKDYSNKEKLMDVLQETRRCKIEQEPVLS